MTTYKFAYCDDKIVGFEIKGHTNFANFGEDIVCAAVSSVALMTCNTITDIFKAKAKIIQDDGFLKLEIDDENLEDLQKLLLGLKLHLDELSKLYPQHISKKEVQSND